MCNVSKFPSAIFFFMTIPLFFNTMLHCYISVFTYNSGGYRFPRIDKQIIFVVFTMDLFVCLFEALRFPVVFIPCPLGILPIIVLSDKYRRLRPSVRFLSGRH